MDGIEMIARSAAIGLSDGIPLNVVREAVILVDLPGNLVCGVLGLRIESHCAGLFDGESDDPVRRDLVAERKQEPHAISLDKDRRLLPFGIVIGADTRPDARAFEQLKLIAAVVRITALIWLLGTGIVPTVNSENER
jgi:hypothetical protein